MPVKQQTQMERDLDDLRFRIRHSAAHIMAESVLKIFPDTKFAVGPAIEDGFYYDFSVERPFTPEDLEHIERAMQESIVADVPFESGELSRAEAEVWFASQPFKLEILAGIPLQQQVTTYQHGEFVDLCRGPHVSSTGEVRAIKLMTVAGAYWRGDERNEMLQRIYGTAWESQAALDEHLSRLEQAAMRDHRKLGRELDLFSTSDQVGAGLIIWHPKGGRIRGLMEQEWRVQHDRRGYEFVYSPHIGKAALWETSGHLGFYRENMYESMEVDGQEYFAKPMNCPFHIQIYKAARRSYRELPMRLTEMGTVYRYERSGVLQGLLRVRGFTQDDAHIFCRPEQVEDEVVGVLDFAFDLLGTFGFEEYDVFLSTKPDKAVGRDEDWDFAILSLQGALERENVEYEIDHGGGAFYGPKLDIKVKDAIGRSWQCTTVQFDFNLPERFDLSFVGQDGTEHRPYMVHRALFGSLERFFGILLEHYGGAFPVWLAPVQAQVIPIADRHSEYAIEVCEELASAGIRVHLDDRNERMNAKIRDAQVQKIPYMLIVGDTEERTKSVSVRSRSDGDVGVLTTAGFASQIVSEVTRKV